MLDPGKVYLGDCMKLMDRIESKSIDMIVCDLPYGQTKNEWDKPIDLVELWAHYKRIIKDSGVIALFGQGMFSAEVMISNKSWHRYNLIWDKVNSTGFLNANKMPLRSHEDIMIFYKKAPVYNPQKVRGRKNNSRGVNAKNDNNVYSDFTPVDNCIYLGDMKHPKSIISIQRPHSTQMQQSNEKPVGLYEWLFRSYTNEGALILDNCLGSGSSFIAALNTNRQMIGIEKHEPNYNKAFDRIYNHMVDIYL